jgi:hypothetical protein
VLDQVTMSVALRDVDGYPDGVYRVGPGGALKPVVVDPEVAARLERAYGYPRTPESGCDVRHASMIWFLSVRPRDLYAAFGPTGWTAAQYVVGWAVHGLTLSATAFDLFARPVRAFDEVSTRKILGLDDDEMIALAAIVGTPKHASSALLDIRL